MGKSLATCTGLCKAYACQVREKEMTNRRAGLLTTVVKWGRVELFKRIVEDKYFADQISPALVQQVYTHGINLARA